MSAYWEPADIGVDPDDYAEGESPVLGEDGLFWPGGGLSDAEPLPDGDAGPGRLEESARADHVHPATSVVVADAPPAGADEETQYISALGAFFDEQGAPR